MDTWRGWCDDEVIRDMFRRGPEEPTDTFGVERMSCEDFMALPKTRPFGLHTRWKTKINGRWALRYAGTSCGVPFQTAAKIVIVAPSPR